MQRWKSPNSLLTGFIRMMSMTTKMNPTVVMTMTTMTMAMIDDDFVVDISDNNHEDVEPMLC